MRIPMWLLKLLVPPFVLRADYVALEEKCAKLEKRVELVESVLRTAAQKAQAKSVPVGSTEIRKPMNTWRTRSTNFTKASITDPSTFPQQKESEDENVSTQRR